MILAVVGTRLVTPKLEEYARLIILNEITSGRWESGITGDAPGIDTLFRDLCWAEQRWCDVLVPEHRRWEPGGYKDRNMKVVDRCDALIAIRHPGSATYGSGWTARHAESCGKLLARVEIS